jgi:TRAP transporter TAXI family solute receptor
MGVVISEYVTGVESVAEITSGAAENMRLLREGSIGLALTTADVAWGAMHGKLDGIGDNVPVRTLMGTYAAYLHLVTRADCGVNAVSDLRGRRVSTGLVGTGAEVKALRVLEAYGITPAHLGMHEHLDYPEAGRALMSGRIDAFTWDSALPASAIFELASAPEARIRLVTTGDAVAKMTAKYGPFYFAAPIPKGTYPGVDGDVVAAAGVILLVAHAGMAEPLAYDITKALLEHARELAATNETAREITLANAVRGSSIPFHPGALRYYREKGVTAFQPPN